MTEARNLIFETTFTVFPQDTNYLIPPMVFGGKVLAEMDIAAAMAAKRVLYDSECDSVVTVALDKVTFFVGAEIGDLIYLRAKIMKLGIKSIVIYVEGWREQASHTMKNLMTYDSDKICEGLFTFVSRKNAVPHPHGLVMPDYFDGRGD